MFVPYARVSLCDVWVVIEERCVLSSLVRTLIETDPVYPRKRFDRLSVPSGGQLWWAMSVIFGDFRRNLSFPQFHPTNTPLLNSLTSFISYSHSFIFMLFFVSFTVRKNSLDREWLITILRIRTQLITSKMSPGIVLMAAIPRWTDQITLAWHRR